MYLIKNKWAVNVTGFFSFVSIIRLLEYRRYSSTRIKTCNLVHGYCPRQGDELYLRRYMRPRMFYSCSNGPVQMSDFKRRGHEENNKTPKPGVRSRRKWLHTARARRPRVVDGYTMRNIFAVVRARARGGMFRAWAGRVLVAEFICLANPLPARPRSRALAPGRDGRRRVRVAKYMFDYIRMQPDRRPQPVTVIPQTKWNDTFEIRHWRLGGGRMQRARGPGPRPISDHFFFPLKVDGIPRSDLRHGILLIGFGTLTIWNRIQPSPFCQLGQRRI